MFEDRLAICLKISQPVWIEKLRNGEAWFGKIDNYIKQAEENNNNEQFIMYAERYQPHTNPTKAWQRRMHLRQKRFCSIIMRSLKLYL